MLHLRRPPYSLEISVAERVHLDKHTENVSANNEDSRLIHLSILAAVIGVIAGFVAFLLVSLIGLISNLVFYQRVAFDFPNLEAHTLGPLVIIVPVIGGLIIGVMAKYGTPKIRGHGIPEAMEAVLTNRSRIAPIVALFKPLSAAIAIGTGGPFGAEGPIIQTGGAFGSIIGQIIRVTAAERKVLLGCGAAAGMAATFSTPIAAVIMAIELLLFEFRARSFIPLVIASTLATTVHYGLVGRGALFDVNPVNFGIPSSLPFYIVFGLICGVFAVGFSKILYWVEDQFERLPLDPMWWPALGGLALGIIGFFMPRVLGVGYDTISAILNNELPLAILLGVIIFKSLALYLTLGSGTSGGLLAPTLMVGAALGASFALVANQLFPGLNLSPGAFALVGMAAVFGAASRAIFTFIIFAFEITRDYNAILPLMLVCVIADLIALKLMRNSIMTEKLARRGLHIRQDYEADVMQQVTVAEVMDPKPSCVASTVPLVELADRIASGAPDVSRRQGIAVLDEQGLLTGIVTRGDILRALKEDGSEAMTAIEAGSTRLIVTYPDELIHDALNKMLQNDIGRLPVVTRENPRKLVGYLGRGAVLEARLKRLKEENVREPGWLRQIRAK
ncbi:MAG: chloride channel protein [Chloroflexi bacterium]|nr:chloride channel protein [Chloroflexota bacterium]MBW7878868.1 chloride channel protein [Anaerolineae bacterium]MDL1916422.1 chloride channel protein [Anaerolineae bacterium CFX4]OQY78114.1 MAG: VWA containing CoxE-like protein [Anaerolineae bacterium UTCFX5]MCC6566260.1 chloride channel protein [Chloroflexota bacterium]